MEEYPRREHFRYFSAMPVPTFGITARVDVTGLVRFCRERRCSFYMRAVNKLRAGEHAHNESPVDDNPRFCWGRYEEDHRGRLMLPFTLNANHALMDGVHAGAFYRRLQEELDKV